MNKVIEEINAALNGNGYESNAEMRRQRRRLYRLRNEALTNEEYMEKLSILQCMQELLAEDDPDMLRVVLKIRPPHGVSLADTAAKIHPERFADLGTIEGIEVRYE